MANTSSTQELLRGCTMHVIKFYIFFIIIIFIHLSFIRSFTLKKVSLVSKYIDINMLVVSRYTWFVWWTTNKTGGRVWIALYVKKQLKLIFNIFNKIYHCIWKYDCFFFSSSFDRFSRPLQLILVLLYLTPSWNNFTCISTEKSA